jgi:hypothetical protein
MVTNFFTELHTITTPPGIFTLMRPGDDAAARAGDLDIARDRLH